MDDEGMMNANKNYGEEEDGEVSAEDEEEK